MLYSLLHLGGFAGDVDFYRGRTAGAARILELGAGDGRVGAELCAGSQYAGQPVEGGLLGYTSLLLAPQLAPSLPGANSGPLTARRTQGVCC